MRQLLVECSDPGLVVSLAEELEHVLRHVDFERARALGAQLTTLAGELGSEVEQAWRPFRLEVPHDGGRPLSFGAREPVDEARVKALLEQAAECGVGRFELRDTLLLPQGGPAPETREQYVRDLADAIRSAVWEEGMTFQSPVALPASMDAHRRQLVQEHAVPVLQARAGFPAVGHRRVEDSVKQAERVLREIDTRSQAVMVYELDRLDPAGMDAGERLAWAALAARLGRGVEKWFLAVAESLSYLYQQAALVWLLWTECRGWGPAYPFLEGRLQDVVKAAEGTYTADGVDALRLVYEDLRRPPWAGLGARVAKGGKTGETGLVE
jgi:hypothetical protein